MNAGKSQLCHYIQFSVNEGKSSKHKNKFRKCINKDEIDPIHKR